MKADLHFHSRFSDGKYWPDQLPRLLAGRGVQVAALTDHDTLAGVPEFLEAARRVGIRGIAAVEIDFVDPDLGIESELLAYFPRGHFAALQAYLEPFLESRRAIAGWAIGKAAREWPGTAFSMEAFMRFKAGDQRAVATDPGFSYSKADFHRYLQACGVLPAGSSYPEFKKRFFAEVPEVKPTLLQCLARIGPEGGYAVLAHPGYQFHRSAERMQAEAAVYGDKLAQARRAGLWGIELHSYKASAEADAINAVVRSLASRCGLQLTTGSDFHSDDLGPWPAPGCMEAPFEGFPAA